MYLLNSFIKINIYIKVIVMDDIISSFFNGIINLTPFTDIEFDVEFSASYNHIQDNYPHEVQQFDPTDSDQCNSDNSDCIEESTNNQENNLDEIDTSYITDLTTFLTRDTYNESIHEQMKESLNICGSGYYVGRVSERMDQDDPCFECNYSDISTIFQNPYENNDIDTNNLSLDAYNRKKELYEYNKYMCSVKPEHWIPSQNTANPYIKRIESPIDWTTIATVTDGITQVTNVNLYKKWFDDRELLSNSDLQSLLNRSEYDGSLDEFKQDISNERGSLVDCSETPNELIGISDVSVPDNFSCSDSKFGPDNIIIDEYIDWRDTRFDNVVSDEPTNMIDLGASLLPLNGGFETCVNNLLNEYDDLRDTELINEIYQVQQSGDITRLETSHIQFIKRKLQMLLVDTQKQGLLDCIDENIYISETICEQGLTDQMNTILQILFSVIGFNFDLNELSNTDIEKKDALLMVINELGDIIPLALKRIIDLSEELEINHCDNRISNKSIVLRDLYNRMFETNTTLVNFDTGISDLVSNSTSTEFNRSTIIASLGIAFLKYF
jgi:hypothetical protein